MQSHYLIIRVEDLKTAEMLAESVLNSYVWLSHYVYGDRADVYYNAANICEDTSRITLVLNKQESEDE